MERHVKMERHIKSRPDGNYQEIVRPGTLRFLDFARPPVMLYIPAQSTYEIVAQSDGLDVGIFSAPSNATMASPALLEGAAVVARQIGRGNWQRTVYSALAENTPAERLLAGETLN